MPFLLLRQYQKCERYFTLWAGNRLEIYPYRHEPSRVYFRRVAPNRSITVQKGIFSDKIIWHQLEQEDLAAFTLELIKRLPRGRFISQSTRTA